MWARLQEQRCSFKMGFHGTMIGVNFTKIRTKTHLTAIPLFATLRVHVIRRRDARDGLEKFEGASMLEGVSGLERLASVP